MRVAVRCWLAAFSVALSLLSPSPVTGQAQASRNLTFSATVRSRASLRVSTSDLRFDVLEGMPPPTIVVDFAAAARARRDGDVQLTVEPLAPIRTASGDVLPGLTVSFEGDTAYGGALSPSGPQVVGAWKGSGVRAGRVSFTLRGAVVTGTYVLPVRFVLSLR